MLYFNLMADHDSDFAVNDRQLKLIDKINVLYQISSHLNKSIWLVLSFHWGKQIGLSGIEMGFSTQFSFGLDNLCNVC
jgi:hypothetical protein